MDITELNRGLMLSFRNDLLDYQSPFWLKGAFVTDEEVKAQLSIAKSPTTVTVPNLVEIDYNLEANYSNTKYNDIAEPRELDFGAVKARIAFMNEVFGWSALRSELNAPNPEELIAQRANCYWAKQMEMRAIASAFGVYNLAGKNSDIVQTSATAFDNNMYIDGVANLGDMDGVMLVNPAIKASMQKTGLVNKVIDPLNNNLQFDTYDNKYLVVDVKNKKTGKFQYTQLADGSFLTHIYGRGAITADSVANSRDMRTETSELRGNGGGYDVLVTRRNGIVHPNGYTWTDALPLTGGTDNKALSPSLMDLTKKENWAEAGGGNIRFIVSK